MRILVCIKQVPFVDQLKFDLATKRLIRDGVGSEINPFDRRAITQAVNLRNKFGGEAVVITMGPPQAKDALIEALAMGCDRAVHLLGREFAGADTIATARALALACRKIGFDLILCGKYSTDAETAQVPPMLAEFLDVPQVTGVTQEVSADGKTLTATRELDDGFETVECPLPAVLSAAERLVKPIRVAPADLEPAKQKPLTVMSAAELSSDMSLFGLSGSPTYVSEIYSIEPTRKRVMIDTSDVDTAARELVARLIDEGLFGEWKSKPRQVIRPRRGKGKRDKAIWVVAEPMGNKIREVTLELLGRGIGLAEKLDSELAAVLIGQEVAAHVQTLAAYGADRVYVAESPALANYSTEAYTMVLANAIREHKPYAVLIPSTANGRDLAPRVAARLNIGLTGDCIGLEIDDQGRLVQLKPAFGGNIVAPILSKTSPAMATMRPGMLQKAEPDFARQVIIERLSVDGVASRTRVVKSATQEAVAGVELESAEIIVAVGMGIGGPENLPKVQELARVLNAPLGATRRVVDAGWLPRQQQIGLTGKSVAPRLYVTIGVRGAFNHTVGIQRAGLVVAINNNPEADIFKQCDYGLVADWSVMVPALTRALGDAKPAGRSKRPPRAG